MARPEDFSDGFRVSNRPSWSGEPECSTKEPERKISVEQVFQRLETPVPGHALQFSALASPSTRNRTQQLEDLAVRDRGLDVIVGAIPATTTETAGPKARARNGLSQGTIRLCLTENDRFM